ncbi:phage protein NinX family protein [Serratia liquefaciens]|uniref:phage protein NinX family protein n=1 Tax=Serratia liquefaciens TaxID=614 RepID=UPI00059EA4D8|nr:phage protein NinX family protein [Serratia liquefaciens]
MIDYSAMSDQQINEMVAIALGEKVADPVNGQQLVMVDGEKISSSFDPCNRPSDAWPIIEANYISIFFDGISWEAHSALSEVNYESWKTHPYQPLRLAMIVFLMIKEADKCLS